MALPLVAVIAALSTGGTLVPHAAGGLIVSSASGYVAGTYLSTTAIASMMAASLTTLGATTAVVIGVATTVVGGAGIFGTTIGATGVVGALMSAGLISSTPVIVPISIGSVIAGAGYLSYRWLRLRRRINEVPGGEELMFSEAEAKMIESVIKRLPGSKPEDPNK